MLLRLATRTSSKVVATAFGIALCVMFLSGSFALLDGLQDSTKKVADRFDEGPVLVYAGPNLEESRLDSTILEGLSDSYCAVRVAAVNISYHGILVQETSTSSVSNATFLEADLAGLDDGEIWVGDAFLASAQSLNVTIPSGASIEVASLSTQLTLTYEKTHPSTLLPDDWALVSEGTMRQLAPSLGANATFLLVGKGSADLPRLQAAGFTALQTAAAVDFFRQGVYSLGPVLWGLALAAGTIIIVLTFTLMTLEMRYREAEMRTLRQIGASPRFLLSLVLLQSLYVTVLGALLGLALGSVVTNAVTSFVPLLGMSTFALPAPSVSSLGIPVVVALIAGLIGGTLPARNAATRVPSGASACL